MPNLFDAIRKAISVNDFDVAVYIIQTALGQKDGFNASIYFTIDSEDIWRDLSPSGRCSMLQSYIAFEVVNFSVA